MAIIFNAITTHCYGYIIADLCFRLLGIGDCNQDQMSFHKKYKLMISSNNCPTEVKMFKIILMLIITNTQTNIHVISPCRKLAYTTNLKWLLSSSTKETNACITPVRVDSLSSFPYLDENERNICNDDLVFNVTVIKKIM